MMVLIATSLPAKSGADIICAPNGLYQESPPAVANAVGRWSCPFNMDLKCGVNGCPSVPNNEGLSLWGRPAIHLILTRGYGTSNSRIWFYSETQDDSMKVWNWNPKVPPQPANIFRGGDVDSLPTAVEIFCGGHSVLPDGRVLITGGQDGINFAGIKNTTLLSAAQGVFLPDGADMEFERWYPTQTALDDGRVFIAGGDRYPRLVLFGGENASGTIVGETYLLDDTSELDEWDAHDPCPPPRDGAEATAREYAAAVDYHPVDPIGRFEGIPSFGGMTASGPVNDVWQYVWNPELDCWYWDKPQVEPSNPANGIPSPRYGASAVIRTKLQDYLTEDRRGGSSSFRFLRVLIRLTLFRQAC